MIAIRLTVQDAVFFQLAEPDGEDIPRRSRIVHNLGEFLLAVKQLPNNQKTPAIAHDLKGGCDIAQAWGYIGGLGLHSRPHTKRKFENQTILGCDIQLSMQLSELEYPTDRMRD